MDVELWSCATGVAKHRPAKTVTRKVVTCILARITCSNVNQSRKNESEMKIFVEQHLPSYLYSTKVQWILGNYF